TTSSLAPQSRHCRALASRSFSCSLAGGALVLSRSLAGGALRGDAFPPRSSLRFSLVSPGITAALASRTDSRAPELGDELVAVAAVPGLGVLDWFSVHVERVPGQQEQGEAGVDAEQARVVGVGEHGLDGLLGLGELDAVGGTQRLVQRPVPLQLPAQAGEAPGRQVGGVDG